MFKKIIFAALIIFAITSCTKNSNNIQLHGMFTETEPYSGRTQLNFISNSLVIKTEHSSSGSSYSDTFDYSFSPGKIILTPAWTNDYTGTLLDFKLIDENSFTIENLYASIPEAPESFMTFKR